MKTELVVIIDRSGSMVNVREASIKGFNSFLLEQKQLPGEANISLVLFNEEYKVVHDAAPLDQAYPLNNDTYIPEGTTALLDAIGKAVTEAEKRVKGQDPKVFVAILTDGLENASREYSRRQIFDMITRKRAEGWEFLFLGANQDAFTEGTSMGVAGGQTAGFRSDSIGTQLAYSTMSASVSDFRSEPDTIIKTDDSQT